MDNNLAKRFTDYRKAAGLSQGTVAEKLGVSRQAVSKWERGDAIPDVDNFVALAELYNVSFNALYYGKPDNENNEPAPATEAVPEAAVETVIEEAVPETASEVAPDEVTESTEVSEEAKEEASESEEKETIKSKVVKKIKKIKTTTIGMSDDATKYLADIPGSVISLALLVSAFRSKNKLPKIALSAAVLPVWHFAAGAVLKCVKNTEKACEEAGVSKEENAEEVTEETNE